jgi:hypothetical protein
MVESTAPYRRINGNLTLPYIDIDLKTKFNAENAKEVYA